MWNSLIDKSYKHLYTKRYNFLENYWKSVNKTLENNLKRQVEKTY